MECEMWFDKAMKLVLPLLFSIVFLVVGSLPEAITSDVSGVRQIEITHTHLEDHHHEHEFEHSDDEHEHDQHSSVADSESEVSDEASEGSHSHSHEVLLVGIQALFEENKDVFLSDYTIDKFPYPQDLETPLSLNLGSIFRPPIQS
jgi:hypothetical protein